TMEIPVEQLMLLYRTMEIPVEQLMLELTLSEHAPKRTQNSKQGVFQLWSYPLNKGSATENR
ncbi:hypothetical protein EI555_019239, partial [Monodon monoceros]